LREERNRISIEEYFWSPDTLHVKCVARCGQDGGPLVLSLLWKRIYAVWQVYPIFRQLLGRVTVNPHGDDRAWVSRVLTCSHPTPHSTDSFLGSVEHFWTRSQARKSKNYCVSAKLDGKSNIFIWYIYVIVKWKISCRSCKMKWTKLKLTMMKMDL
jgi:hypothetical protein